MTTYNYFLNHGMVLSKLELYHDFLMVYANNAHAHFLGNDILSEADFNEYYVWVMNKTLEFFKSKNIDFEIHKSLNEYIFNITQKHLYFSPLSSFMVFKKHFNFLNIMESNYSTEKIKEIYFLFEASIVLHHPEPNESQ
jgi:hypothetical protein